MTPRRHDDDTAIAERGTAPPGEVAPRQLAALLRIEDLLTEIRDLLSQPLAPTAPKRKT